MIITCPACATELPAYGQAVCRHCGAELPASMASRSSVILALGTAGVVLALTVILMVFG